MWLGIESEFGLALRIQRPSFFSPPNLEIRFFGLPKVFALCDRATLNCFDSPKKESNFGLLEPKNSTGILERRDFGPKIVKNSTTGLLILESNYFAPPKLNVCDVHLLMS